MQYCRSAFLISLLLFTAGCLPRPKQIHSHDWPTATKEVYQQYHEDVDRILQPAFARAHVPYPPTRIALLAFKQEQRLELWAQGKEHQWHYIKTYPVLAKSGGPGPKLRQFDRQIPEGIYQISFLHPFSQLHLSMKLNYPNDFDRKMAHRDGRKELGGDIYIHGKALSAGCLAIGDAAIEELFVLVYRVGAKNAKVIIAPDDIRHKPLVQMPATMPKWVAELEQHIATALTPFSEPVVKKGRAIPTLL